MPLVKLFKIHGNYDYDEYSNETLASGTSDWEDISEADLKSLKDAVVYANVQNKYGFKWLIIEQTLIGEGKEDIYKSYKDFIKTQEERKRKYEEKKRLEREKREAKALERKQRQLEKLKKELGV